MQYAFAPAALCALAYPTHADTPMEALPITEVTAFKDGHALVVRAGKAPLDERGDVVLHELPRPLLGAFWVDVHEQRARLASVVSQRVEEERKLPAATPADLLRANVGARIAFLDPRNGERIGLLREVVTREPDEAEHRARPTDWSDWQWRQYLQSQPAQDTQRLIVVEGDDGVTAVPIDQVRDLRFLSGPPKTEVSEMREHQRMTLDLAWDGAAPTEGDVRLMYVQRGLRWIPSYRVTMLDDAHVRLELQATLVNELADLQDVTVNFAVGVPSFAFQDTLDPMALSDALADLGPYFMAASPTGGMLSNAVMSQIAGRSSAYSPSESDGGGQATASELTGSERAEDLFVYTLEHLTLAKGARMVVPLVRYDSCYETVYRLDLPARPPFDLTSSIDSQRRAAFERALSRPVPTHVLRITNENPDKYPITTAPALVIQDGRALAQGMLTYAAPGATTDLDIGAGLDISVDTKEVESERTLAALRWNGNDYARAEVAFAVTLTNRKDEPIRLEVNKIAFGEAGSAEDDGLMETLSPYDDALATWDQPWAWWRGYSWPWWWSRFNAALRIRWEATIEAGQSQTLEAHWRYTWQ